MTSPRPRARAAQLKRGARRARRAAACNSTSVLSGWISVREDIFFGPARQIERGPSGYKVKTGLGKGDAAFTFQHLVEAGLQFMEIEHVLGRILLLRIAQHMSPPIGALLLLVEFNAEQFLHQILE